MKFISSKLHVRRCPLIYISKGNRYLRQSGCSFSFSVPCVREIEKVKSEKVKTKAKYKNVTRFSKLLRSAPPSSLKLVCEASLRNYVISHVISTRRGIGVRDKNRKNTHFSKAFINIFTVLVHISAYNCI